ALDDAVAGTFPASDAPAWNATHAGAPVARIVAPVPAPEALRVPLRADLERLGEAPRSADERRKVREDIVARAMLASGHAVIREPVGGELMVRTLELTHFGSMHDASCVIVTARYDAVDASGIAALLAIARGLAPMDLVRSVRLVALPESGTRASAATTYADRLARTGVSVRAMVSLERLDLARDHEEAEVLVVGDRASRDVVRLAERALQRATRIAVHGVSLPSWVPGVGGSDNAAFWPYGWPAVKIAEGPLWWGRARETPDVDRIAALVPGLLAAVARLADA
ncbi:MAG TPA: M28 family peptidase, partial [Polyangiaceae bacterium]|nr:M28 family peptidase [Polyangiaceae bacterium]